MRFLITIVAFAFLTYTVREQTSYSGLIGLAAISAGLIALLWLASIADSLSAIAGRLPLNLSVNLEGKVQQVNLPYEVRQEGLELHKQLKDEIGKFEFITESLDLPRDPRPRKGWRFWKKAPAPTPPSPPDPKLEAAVVRLETLYDAEMALDDLLDGDDDGRTVKDIFEQARLALSETSSAA